MLFEFHGGRERSQRQYFQAFIGYKTSIVPFSENSHRARFSATTDMLMHYRLCDILTWVHCPEFSGPVPTHIRKKYESPDRIVSNISAQ
jgi:hypothetical protein